jgi:3-hydroxyisobutyrate dehydrogenase-like beta-hydroxyacid dehydrogenase
VATPPRKLESQVIHAIRRRVVFSDNAAAGVEIGVIPAGSFVKSVFANKETAFSGGTPVVSVGTTAVPTAFATSANLAPGTAGYLAVPASTGQGNVTADTQVLAFVSGGATAGLVDLVIEFYPHAL